MSSLKTVVIDGIEYELVPKSLTEIKVDKNGNIKYYKNDVKHRENDTPAVMKTDGTLKWYRDGKLNRDNDKPAVEKANGDRMWYKNDKLHRDGDKPAIEYANGDKSWYLYDKLHRDGDKPAIEYANGDKSWYLYDVRQYPAEYCYEITSEYLSDENKIKKYYESGTLVRIEYPGGVAVKFSDDGFVLDC